MMKSRLFPILLLTALVMPGCTLPPSAGETPQLRNDLARMQQSQQEISRRMVQVENTLARLESRLQDQQGATDELRRSTETQKVTSIGQKTEPSTVDTLPDPTTSPSELYLQAFSDYASGRYSQAIQGFGAFIGNYPSSDYAGNAQYWLGECYYALENYDQAVRELQKVGDRYPGSDKAPDALLKMVPSLRKLNQFEQARKIREDLLRLYPDSAAAQKALSAD